jgi:hypothetical protein
MRNDPPQGALSREWSLRSRRLAHRVLLRLAPSATVGAACRRLSADLTATADQDSPIFVLGSGWRTGSTLMQRMLNDTPKTLIWGEPYSEGAIVQRLAESIAFLDPENGRFQGKILSDDAAVPGEEEWTANMTPPLPRLVDAHRAMLDQLFKVPAALHGAERWGIKEVVWGRDVIDLLALLYPAARFVLLVRDPVAQWRSYRPQTRRPWFYRWPESPIGSPVSFGRLWDRLVREFVLAATELPQATLVRYEDLDDADELERLTDFLGLDVPLRAGLRRVGSSPRGRSAESVPRWEEAVIRRITRSRAELVGYA